MLGLEPASFGTIYSPLYWPLRNQAYLQKIKAWPFWQRLLESWDQMEWVTKSMSDSRALVVRLYKHVCKIYDLCNIEPGDMGGS